MSQPEPVGQSEANPRRVESRRRRSPSHKTTARKRREEFRRVMDWLNAHDYHIVRGWGDEAEIAHHAGHTMEALTDHYGKRTYVLSDTPCAKCEEASNA